MFTVLDDGRRVEVVRTDDATVSVFVTERDHPQPACQMDFPGRGEAFDWTETTLMVPPDEPVWTEYDAD